MLRCIHCLKPAGDTRDHVFPTSWYPDSTPGEIQRPIAPSCEPCNGKSGHDESHVLGRLGLCVDPTKLQSAGIAPKALRAVGIGADADLSVKEKTYRSNLKKKLLQQMSPYTKVAGKSGIVPGFGPRGEFPRESQIAVSVNAESLKRVCRKIVRGLEYTIAGRYIEPPYMLEVYFIEDEAAQLVARWFGPASLHLGPGFHVQRASSQDDHGNVLYRIKVWDSFLVHGSIIIPEKTKL